MPTVILEKPIRIPRSLSVKAASVLKGFLNKVSAALSLSVSVHAAAQSNRHVWDHGHEPGHCFDPPEKASSFSVRVDPCVTIK